MYERFTDRARKVMQLANQEAQRLKHEYLGPEHILLGLAKEGVGVAAHVLKNLGIDVGKILLQIDRLVQSGTDTETSGELPTPRAKKVIEYAMEEARNLNHIYVGTEHLLLGLLRQETGVAAQILMNLGLKLENVRQEVLNMLGHGLEVPEATEGSTPLQVPTNKSTTPTLDKYGCDLTDLARRGQLDPLVAYLRELTRALQILCRRESSNPLLVGAVENGARQIAEGLSQLIVDDNVPQALSGCRIVEFDMPLLVATQTQDQLKKLISALIEELRRAKNTLLFIENIGSYLKPTESEPDSAMSLLRLALSRGDVRCIGSTTMEDYQTTFLRDPVLFRQFQFVQVDPLSPEQTLYLLQNARDRLEAHHRVEITDRALASAVRLSELFLPQESFPAKARSLVDEAAAEGRLRLMVRPPDVRELEEDIERLNVGKEEAVANQDFETAAGLRDQADKLKRRKAELVREFRKKQLSEELTVDENAVVSALSRLTGIPEEAIRAENTSAIPLPPAVPQEGVSEYERLQCSSILQGQGIQILLNTSLVLMPYRPEFDRVLDVSIRPALHGAGIPTQRAADILQPGPIISQVWESIRTAEIIIADASGQNPNVMFELGLCFAAYRFPILLVQDDTDLPVNMQALRYIPYTDTDEGLSKLTDDLAKTIRAFLSATRKRL